MVIKTRLLLAVASALALMLTAAAPMAAATREAKPSPLRASSLLRVKAFSANGNTAGGSIVAIGYQEATKPGRLFLTFSTDGGKDYRRPNGKTRRFSVVGQPSLGMSLDICDGKVWAATAYHGSSDKAGDSDVFMSSRTIGGGAAQALMTSTADDRRVRDVTVSCAGPDLLAIGWLQKQGRKVTARLMLRSTDALGSPPKVKRTFNLGLAELKSGLDVAATSTSVAVSFVRDGNLRLKRFDLAGTQVVKKYPQTTIAWRSIKYPVMDARGKQLVVAYSKAGKVRAKTSSDRGATFSGVRKLAGTGSLKNPSKAYSISVVGDKIMAALGVYSKTSGTVTPQRVTSTNGGETWSRRSFGNVGTRYVSLLKRNKATPATFVEAWHNNAPKGTNDTIRARYEVP